LASQRISGWEVRGDHEEGARADVQPDREEIVEFDGVEELRLFEELDNHRATDLHGTSHRTGRLRVQR
jgi:hypothetical protein